MSGSTTELRDLLARLDAYVVRSAADATVPRPPTPAEAMATYEMAARLVESDLSRPGTPRDLTVHRDVLVGTHRMLKAALDAHGSEPRRLATRPALRLVGGKLTRRTD